MIRKIDRTDFDIDTNEGYNTGLYQIGINLIVPYINIKLILYRDKEFIRYNKSALVFKSVLSTTSSTIILKNLLENDSFEPETHYINCNNSPYFLHRGDEVSIECKGLYLFTSENSLTTKSNEIKWIPWDTPNFNSNMDKHDVDNFFNEIPNEIIEFLSSDHLSL